MKRILWLNEEHDKGAYIHHFGQCDLRSRELCERVCGLDYEMLISRGSNNLFTKKREKAMEKTAKKNWKC
jgi:hypothetical protein